ncbi:hypothetical protein [Pseudoduganella umbonata]|uniref:Uncharacterized protein n=1 Tax=Pseudoduganella umbonata TaxID=864828 RepID=A0A4P8HQ30_9BURK|nr:hypothetical protein [Pseudoduganella umbonata]MBB3221417.1 hypothetical protein [Pseudoduganella umbonata]QCP10574.1 hypothetical protein FCL38_09135 [Pseudoduganella umbonata]
MAIDRISPSSAALTIPERVARERPGQQQPAPAPAPGGTPMERFDPAVPAAVGALLEAMEGRLAAGSQTPAVLAGALAAEALLADAASMQPNQLFMARQLVSHAPEPSAMAASWMAMIRTYAEQRNALLAQAHGRHVPASLFLAEGAPHVLRGARLPAQLVSELDAWRFAVYAWGAEKLVLRVVTLQPDDGDDATQPRQQPRVALRLEVYVAELGKVVLQMEPAAGGTLLDIGAAQAGALQHMRTLLREIGDIARRCGVHLLRVRLARELPAPGHAQPGRMQVAMLGAPLFKAIAEMAVLLSRPAPVM